MDQANPEATATDAKRGELDELVNRALTFLNPPPGRERDLESAHRLLTEASARGNVTAMRMRASLLATGTGCRADSQEALALIRQCAARGDAKSRLELIMLERMPAHRIGEANSLSAEPLIEHRRNFLSGPECGYLMAMAEPQFKPSVILDPVSGERRPDPVRTSDGMSFGPLSEDLVIHAINHRVASATNTPYGHGEPLHMLRYRGGQEYRPHGDALPGSGNIRHWTVLLYLNDDYEGGETEFPLLDVKVKAAAGDMLRFCNVDSRGEANRLSQHAGLPVPKGTKYVATRWIRERPYHPWA